MVNTMTTIKIVAQLEAPEGRLSIRVGLTGVGHYASSDSVDTTVKEGL